MVPTIIPWWRFAGRPAGWGHVALPMPPHSQDQTTRFPSSWDGEGAGASSQGKSGRQSRRGGGRCCSGQNNVHTIEKKFFKYNFDTFIHSVKCRTHDNVFSGRESRCPWIFSPTYFSLGGTLSKEHIETEQKALRKKKKKTHKLT